MEPGRQHPRRGVRGSIADHPIAGRGGQYSTVTPVISPLCLEGGWTSTTDCGRSVTSRSRLPFMVLAPCPVQSSVRGVVARVDELEPRDHAEPHGLPLAGEVADLDLDVGPVPDHRGRPPRRSSGNDALCLRPVPAVLDDQPVARARVGAVLGNGPSRLLVLAKEPGLPAAGRTTIDKGRALT